MAREVLDDAEIQTTNDQLQLRFVHPHTSDTYAANVAPACTAKIAIEQLKSGTTGPFLAPNRDYDLVLTRTDYPLNESDTMAEAGARSGDVLEVRQASQGA